MHVVKLSVRRSCIDRHVLWTSCHGIGMKSANLAHAWGKLVDVVKRSLHLRVVLVEKQVVLVEEQEAISESSATNLAHPERKYRA